jgi:hypothetical protein
MLSLRFSLILLIFASAAPCPASSPDGLGKIIFSNSCLATAQPALLKGIAQLHSFQYGAAEKAFAESKEADRQCAMAYWGLAMSSYRPLWDGANEKAIAKGRSYLEKIQTDWPATPREREYISAIKIIFGDNRRLGDDRIAEYSKAMGQLSRHYPDDGEAQAFYALSLLALPSRGDDTAIRRQVIDVLTRLSAVQPQHPGAVHYLIHAADTPELAPEGLAAARRYAKIAPDSSHALHMPAHIFVRLGLWQESIDSNLAAAAAAAEATQQQMGEAQYQLHAMDFLNYSYLQMGEQAKALQVIADLNKVPGSGSGVLTNVRVNLTTRTLLELHRWKEALALAPEGDPDDQQMVYLLHTIAAARMGDARLAGENLKKLKQSSKHDRHKDRFAEDYRRKVAEAWVDFAKAKRDKAVAKIRAAADIQDKDDPGPFGVTAREMLADMLLDLHQPGPAWAAYQAVLKLGPNRFNALYGAALAADMAGDSAKSQTYFSKLRENCPPQADRDELQKVKTAAAGAH